MRNPTAYAAARLAEVRKTVTPPCPTEHQDQCALIDWWGYACKGYKLPAECLIGIPNAGAGISRGQAGKMKGEGARPGVPDLLLAVPCSGFAGLWIELKRERDARVSPVQLHMQKMLRHFGYRVEVCYGLQPAMEVIRDYLA